MTVETCKNTNFSKIPEICWEWVDCNLCGSDDTEIYHRERLPYFDKMLDFEIVRCRSCGLVYTNPRLAEHNATYLAGEENPDQIEKHAHAKTAVFDNALEQIHAFQQKLTHTSKGKLLDVGCGSGHFLRQARQFGFDVCGIEPAEAAARYASQNLGVDVINDDLLRVHLEPESIDVITAWDVLEHLGDPQAALNCCLRWLKPNGILAVRFPSATWQKIKGMILHGLFSSRRAAFAPTMHLYFFNEDTFTRMAHQVGLEVLCTRTTPAEANTDSFALDCIKLVSHAVIRSIETFGRRHLGNLEVYCRKI
jgi:2-polyprenyl-3-methyl-5-hydroxy-6-metoxy-1,4-benzoquinol methylase